MIRDTFDFQDELFMLFRSDSELCNLLGINVEGMNEDDMYNLLNNKLRREDFSPEQFTEDTLDFIAFYFADADTSNNYLLNRGLLRLDIYSKYRYTAGQIRKRCVQLISDTFDIRVVAEGQKQSEITNVYKYRLELLPLVGS